ncbi:hypothetical protein ACFVHB_19960 [Kitasatospora sp. NPDC127111]|uniref:hypothetical protein n=1 Tax=Kitasatospora sp. NPDC127111 TaxID=3345363 RepID=UPI003641FFB0
MDDDTVLEIVDGEPAPEPPVTKHGRRLARHLANILDASYGPEWRADTGVTVLLAESPLTILRPAVTVYRADCPDEERLPPADVLFVVDTADAPDRAERFATAGVERWVATDRDQSTHDAPGGTMPRGTINVTTSDKAGAVVPAATVGDPTNGHTVANDGRTLLLVENSGSTVARTVTLQMAKTVDGVTMTGARTVSVAAGVTKLLGPYSTADYGSALLVDVDHAEIKIRAFRS